MRITELETAFTRERANFYNTILRVYLKIIDNLKSQNINFILDGLELPDADSNNMVSLFNLRRFKINLESVIQESKIILHSLRLKCPRFNFLSLYEISKMFYCHSDKRLFSKFLRKLFPEVKALVLAEGDSSLVVGYISWFGEKKTTANVQLVDTISFTSLHKFIEDVERALELGLLMAAKELIWVSREDGWNFEKIWKVCCKKGIPWQMLSTMITANFYYDVNVMLLLIGRLSDVGISGLTFGLGLPSMDESRNRIRNFYNKLRANLINLVSSPSYIKSRGVVDKLENLVFMDKNTIHLDQKNSQKMMQSYIALIKSLIEICGWI